MNNKILHFSYVCCFSALILFPDYSLADNSTGHPDPISVSNSQSQFDKASHLIKQKKIIEGVLWLEKAAQNNHAEALYVLASYYELGVGVTQSFAKAQEFYQQAARLNHQNAQFNLALLLVNPKAGINDLSTARTLLMELAKQGDIEAKYSLSLLYKQAYSTTRIDEEKSIYWLKEAAQKGHGKAQNNLGLHYLQGKFVVKDIAKAFKWQLKAATHGIVSAQFNVALMYENGTGTKADHGQSLHWYQVAARRGNANAQQNMGIKYLLGDPSKFVEPDFQKAVTLITQAANQNHRNAQYLLGRLYEEGRGSFEVDIKQAESWYLLAAKQGYADAQYQLALVLDKKKDLSNARFWLKQAVLAGHEKAVTLHAQL